MAISLKNLLLTAEETGANPDGSTFEQRSLGYGDNKPLIVKQLPGVNQTKILDSQGAQLINEVSDNFIRGGAIGATEAAVTDVARLGKVLLSPNGLSWAASQAALSKTNPTFYANDNPIAGGANNRVTSPAHVIGTAGTGAAGIRFRRDRILDVKRESGYNYEPKRGGPKYESNFLRAIKSGVEEISDNTLYGAYNKIVNKGKLGIIKEYKGGPHSTFGIGDTTIKQYISNPFNDIGENGGYLPLFNQGLFNLRQGPNPTKTDAGSPDYTDYRSATGRSNNVTQTRIGLYNLGDPGATSEEIRNGAYNVPVEAAEGAIDKITQTGIFSRKNFNRQDSNPELKDYIKFRIAVVNTEEPIFDNVIQFRALLDSMSDNYTGNWNSYKYNGRAEEFYTYAGFQRGINFSFKIHTQTRHEQGPLWNKLNYLVAQTSPEYKNNRMRGVFSRLTIGDWISEVPGFFTSVGLSWATSYPWEIQQDPEGLDSDVKQYPHVLDVSCAFQPIHNFAPSNSTTTPFIIAEA